MDPILAIAKKHNLFVIEDCAQAHMAEYHGKRVGTLGDVACFSFQQSKHVTTGDGGMVVASGDNARGRSLRLCSDKGWPRKLGGRDHYFLAPNYHMTELQAAVGLAQIEKYPQCIAGRREAAQRLDDNLRGLEVVRPLGTHPDCTQTYFHYGLRVNLDRISVGGPQFAKALEAEGLVCELGYPGEKPLYLYPSIRDKMTFGASGWPFTSPLARKQWDYEPGLCPEAEKSCTDLIVLPWNERLKSEHVDMISDAIHKVCKAYST
jgi:perosamine synthetase